MSILEAELTAARAYYQRGSGKRDPETWNGMELHQTDR